LHSNLAFNDESARRHSHSDAVEPRAAAFDDDLRRLARSKTEDLADFYTPARGSEFDPFDFRDGLAHEMVRGQTREIEPLGRRRTKGERHRFQGKRSLR
jgi:hypothetical protein